MPWNDTGQVYSVWPWIPISRSQGSLSQKQFLLIISRNIWPRITKHGTQIHHGRTQFKVALHYLDPIFKVTGVIFAKTISAHISRNIWPRITKLGTQVHHGRTQVRLTSCDLDPDFKVRGHFCKNSFRSLSQTIFNLRSPILVHKCTMEGHMSSSLCVTLT